VAGRPCVPDAPRCEGIEALAMFYVDGELAEADARELDAHLRECAACRDHVARLRASLGEVRRLAGARAPERVRTRIRGALDGEDDRAPRRRSPWRWLLPAFAGLIVAVVALDVGTSRRPAGPAVAPMPAAPEVVPRLHPAVAGMQFVWTARWLDDRAGRRELVELWRVRDKDGNEAIIEIRIVVACEPVPVLSLRQYH
jgi:anti-sigma factor RsiW